MGRSIALVSSRGGIGKSVAVSQLSAAHARANPDTTVIVIDASLHADSSAHLYGGLQEPTDQYLDAKSLADGMISALPPTKTFAGLLRALASAPAPAASSFSRMWARAPAPARINLLDFTVNPSADFPAGRAPSNLHLIAGGRALKSVEAAQAPALATALAEVIKAAPADFLIVMDSDAELLERPASTIVAAAADKIALVASSFWADFLRALSDPTNSVIDLLDGLKASGRNAKKLDHIIFTQLNKTRNNESLIWNAPVLNFQAHKDALQNVEQIVSYVYERHTAPGAFSPYITDPVETRISELTERFVSGLFSFPEGIIQRATLKAIPIATMDASSSTAEALDISQQTLAHVSHRVFTF